MSTPGQIRFQYLGHLLAFGAQTIIEISTRKCVVWSLILCRARVSRVWRGGGLPTSDGFVRQAAGRNSAANTTGMQTKGNRRMGLRGRSYGQRDAKRNLPLG